MKAIKIITAAALVAFACTAFAQDLYIPKEIRKAFTNGTRDLNGNPGAKYWQNKSEYSIDAGVDSYNRILTGKESIRYYNNSPDTLKYVVIRLYQDFVKPGKPRDWEVNEKHLGEGVILGKVTLNKTDIDINGNKIKRSGTKAVINVPVNPGTANDIYIEWSFKLPDDFPRMGVYDSTSYMVAYWYPQVSVYDDIDGWDEADYNGLVEFYNDFCDFDVKIKTDRPNMCVWATGLLQNPQDIFTDKYILDYNSARNGSSKFKVDLSALSLQNQITKNDGKNEWNFKAENVTDFAFAMSDHYVWEMKQIEVAGGKKLLLNTAFKPNATALNKHNVFDVANKTLEFLSKDFPGVPYPFPSMSVFNGEGGMEFPMMVNDDDTETWNSTVYLTSHEISHSYFPFYMGINEQRYGWMDEGWAVYQPQDFQTMMQKYTPEDEKKNNFRTDSREYNIISFQRSSGTLNDIPMIAPSDKIKNPSYRINAYNKAATVYDILKDMLGKDVFMNCLHEYMDRWHGKHPMPYDFFFIFNSVSGRNLNWFWKKWFFETGSADLGIGAVKEKDGALEVEVINRGGMPVPVSLEAISGDKTINSVYETAGIWASGKDRIIMTLGLKGKADKLKLGGKYIPDTDQSDNVIELH